MYTYVILYYFISLYLETKKKKEWCTELKILFFSRSSPSSLLIQTSIKVLLIVQIILDL